ncbi:MAG: LysR family transcriptional regulator [Azospirillaceae bacterium]
MGWRGHAFDIINAKSTRIDSVYDLAIFVHIADTGSLSGAARDLDLSLAFVSKRLQRLEAALGIRLINRTTRRLALTGEGARFYEHARSILREVQTAEEAVALAKEAVTGVLTMTASITFSRRHLAPCIARFQEAHPDARFRLIATDGLLDIVEEGVDIAVRQASPADSTLMAQALVSDQRVLCASPAYVERFGEPRHPHDLPGHRCVVFGTPPMTDWMLTDGNETVDVAVDWHVSLSGGDAAHAATMAGAGIAFKSVWEVADDIRAGNLVRLLPAWRSGPRRIHALLPSNRYKTPLVRAFVDFMAADLRASEARILDV